MAYGFSTRRRRVYQRVARAARAVRISRTIEAGVREGRAGPGYRLLAAYFFIHCLDFETSIASSLTWT